MFASCKHLFHWGPAYLIAFIFRLLVDPHHWILGSSINYTRASGNYHEWIVYHLVGLSLFVCVGFHFHSHTCAPLTTPAHPHIADIVSVAAGSPVNKQSTQISPPVPSKSIMTVTTRQWGWFLEVLEVNAKLAGFSSSLHMQSASCMTLFKPHTQSTVTQQTKKSRRHYCELPSESVDIKGAWDSRGQMQHWSEQQWNWGR